MSLIHGLGMTGLNSLLGTQVPPSNSQAYQQYGQGLANASFAQQQYNQALMRGLMNQQAVIEPPKWVFDGKKYETAREMADAIWAVDCPQKTHFLLKYE